MKIKNILYAVFPGIGNCASNKELRKQLFPDEGQKDIKFDTVLSASTHPDIITDEKLNELYNDSLTAKDKLEDKAKATILCVTVSVSLILGASGLLDTVASRYSSPFLRWICYAFFIYAAFSMISAAIMDIKVLVNENTIYTVPPDCSKEDIRGMLDSCISKNQVQNLIRNNYIYSAYEYIRNGLICLFIILLLGVVPINKTTYGSLSSVGTNQECSYSEHTLQYLAEHDYADIKSIIERALPSMQVASGNVYTIADSGSSVFVKFQIVGTTTNVLSVDDISWTQ